MTDSNLKIVKLDPTGTFIQKDDPKEEPSIKSVYTEDGSSSSEKTPIGDDLTQERELTQEKELTQENEFNDESSFQKEEPQDEPPINHLSGGGDDVSVRSQESEDYQNDSVENNLNTDVQEGGGSNDENNNNNEENNDEETEVFDLTNEKAYDILRGVLEDDDNNNVSDNLSKIHEKIKKQNELLEEVSNKLKPIQDLNETLQNQNRIFERLTTAIEKYVEASFESDDESEDEPLAVENVEKIIRNVKPVSSTSSVKKFSNRITTPKVLKN